MEFKLNIADSKTGKCIQKTIAEPKASVLLGMKVGSSIKGDDIGFAGYEFTITGGSDFCGVPMRKGIGTPRKRILIKKGVGFRGGRKGMKKRKTVCGETIDEKITQINARITKHGKEKLFEAKEEKKPAEEKKEKEGPKKEKEEKNEKVKEESKKEEKTKVKEEKKEPEK